MTVQLLKCGHCAINNTVATCTKCKRSFVVVARHLNGDVRQFDDAPLQVLPTDMANAGCDFCFEKRSGKLAEEISAGLRQRTCAACHTEFLTQYGL